MSIKTFVCSILVLAFAVSICGIADAQDKQLRTEKVKPGDLKGFLRDTKGRPFPNVEMTIENEEGQVVQRAVTNANGEYTFKNLPEGNFTLKVAGQPAFKLEVTPAASVTAIQARLPGTVRDEESGGVIPESLTALEWTVLVVGGVGVAVAVPAIIHHNESSSSRKKKVSP